MSAIKGVLSKAAIGEEAVAWGTEAATYELCQFNSESMSEKPESVFLNALGAPGQKPSEKGGIVVTGDFVMKGDYYNALGILLKAAMGSVSLGVYNLTDELATFFSLKVEKKNTGKLWTYLGCKVQSLKISGNAKDQFIIVTATIVAKSKTVATGSISETFTNESLVLMSQLTARLADRADALAAGDIVLITDWELSMDRNLKGDDFVGGSHTILEPLINGHRKVGLTMTIPRIADDTYAGYQQNRTPLQCDLVFTDATKTLTIEVPYLILSDGGDTPIGGPEIVPGAFTLDAYLNSTAIMGDVDNEFRVTIA